VRGKLPTPSLAFKIFIYPLSRNICNLFSIFQLGSFCFCGYHTDSSSFHPQVDPNTCNYQCPQNASQICGGLLAISIYKLGMHRLIF